MQEALAELPEDRTRPIDFTSRRHAHRQTERMQMLRMMPLAALACVVAAACSPAANETPPVQSSDPPAAAPAFDTDAVIASWVGLWATYDLDVVDELFLTDARVTYFSSETEGLITGIEAVREHHAGFGFVSGGVVPEQELWVEDVHATELGLTAVVGATWYFGNRDERASAQRGPMTAVYVADRAGYRIAHMHFATYDGDEG